MIAVFIGSPYGNSDATPRGRGEIGGYPSTLGECQTLARQLRGSQRMEIYEGDDLIEIWSLDEDGEPVAVEATAAD